MVRIEFNRKLIPVKLSYFLFFASTGPALEFLPTMARQLGYSIKTYGAFSMVISLIRMIIIPLIGIIVDKFHVKRMLFLMAITLIGVFMIFFKFQLKLPSETEAELNCASNIINLVFDNKNVLNTTQNSKLFNKTTIDDLIECNLGCQSIPFDDKRIIALNNQSNSRDNLKTTINNFLLYPSNRIDVTFMLKHMKLVNSSYVFHVLSIKMNDTKISETTCQMPMKSFCHINCSNKDIMRIATSPIYRGNVLYLHQFWIFFFVVNLFCLLFTVYSSLISSICIDLLDEKPEIIGKQKLWGSIGWGSSSIFVGWLVDWWSFGKKEKDYSVVFYSGLILSICNVACSTNIQVVESKKIRGKFKNVLGLLTKRHVVAFCIWSAFIRFFHSIIYNFLFWFMEDLVSKNNDDSQRIWLKTIQGLTISVKCILGEIPFFFWAGWIINKLGHVQCMALVLGTMAVRMYLFTVISNPAWILLIEILNGITLGLGISVKMSYGKRISPPDSTSTVLGFIAFIDYIGKALGSLTGGVLFYSYGGEWSFRFFAYISAFMCFVNILSNKFGLTKNLQKPHYIIAVSTKSQNEDDNVITIKN